MSLRYFQPSFGSTEDYVPKYAPLPLDAIQYGAEKAAQTYELGQQALDAYTEQHQNILSQLTPQNRAQAQDVLERDSQLIDRLSDPDGDIPYQDILPTLRRKTRQSMREIQPYIEDSQQMRSFQERIQDMYDKAQLSPTQYQSALIQMSDYEGLQFDDDGRARGFQAPHITRSVDIHKRLQDFMKHLEDGNTTAMLQEVQGDDRFVREVLQKYRTQKDVTTIYQMLLDRITTADPEASEFLLAEHHATNVLREHREQDPIDINEFTQGIVKPYVVSQAMGSQSERFMRNPAFSREDMANGMLSGTLVIGAPEHAIETPGQFLGMLQDAQDERQGIANDVGAALERFGISHDINAETGELSLPSDYLDSDGRDQSDFINRSKLRLQNANESVRRLEAYDQDVRRDIGAPEDWLEIMAAEEEAYMDVYRGAGKLDRFFGLDPSPEQYGRWPWQPRFDTPEEQQRAVENFRKSRAYQGFMERANPYYKEYAKQMKRNAEAGSREVQTFQAANRAQNAFMADYVKTHNPPLFDGMHMTPLEDKIDITKANYTGMFTVPGGRTMAGYQLPDEDGENPRIIAIDVPPQMAPSLLRGGTSTEFDRITLNLVGQLTSAPGGQNELELPFWDLEGDEVEGPKIQVRKLRRGEVDRGLGHAYHVIVPSSAGDVVYWRSTMQEVADIYRDAQSKFYEKLDEQDDQ